MAKAKKKPEEAAVHKDKAFSTENQDFHVSETSLEEIEVPTTESGKDTGSAEKEDVDKKTVKRKSAVLSVLGREKVITESSDDAREFYNQSRFGSLTESSGKVELSLLEALYLMEKGRLIIKNDAGRALTFESYLKKARKVEPNFWIRYCVFKDMRNRGYIIKTALKFGADFRVYDRGVKPGEDHARWIIYPVHEGDTLTWYEFAAKNRVAHSTKKRLLIGIVDDEGDVTYYEIKWMRP
ncbi:MAG: tRNA-intron lyase [Nanoarchaeota archaeon]|nr:tRNA-intron lyase [Nanoarchaeota archaeon]